MQEIERKWLLNKVPASCREQNPIHYERHFIYSDNGVEIRIQNKGDKYEFERKTETSDLSRTGVKFEITEEEYILLKQLSIASLERQSYIVNENGCTISIKEYLGKHKGLVRAEVEFSSEQSANEFVAPSWFGEEITQSVLGKDKKLIELSEIEFKNLLDSRRDSN